MKSIADKLRDDAMTVRGALVAQNMRLAAEQLDRLDSAQPLIDEIATQAKQRQRMYQDAGGDPEKMSGDLTCYVPWSLLKAVLE